MDHLELLQLGGKVSWALFIFAFGACCGSLTNVLVYRLPLGLDVVSAPSRCPACGNRLTWRENIPVFGWLALRGRCRFCKSPISPEYPMVEAFMGLMFVAVFALWYLIPADATWLGISWGAARPDWAMSDAFDGFPRTTWAPLVVVLMLLASLTAMTLVDAKTFTIPLHLPWFATGIGILLHTIGAAVSRGALREHAPFTPWSIPVPDMTSSTGWWWFGASFGGVAGLVIANVLLHFRLIGRSFADYNEWEAKALAAKAGAPVNDAPATGAQPEAVSHDLPITAILPNAVAQPELHTAGPVGDQAGAGARTALGFIAITLAAIAACTLAGWMLASATIAAPPWIGLAAGVVVGPFVGAAAVRDRLRRTATSSHQADGGPASESQPEPAGGNPALWIQYPHARREMVKELLFLTPCIGLAWLGGTLAVRLGAAANPTPMWLTVLSGVLMGYLIGGGVVWAVRIGASLAFGKEAIGLGDVHLMAAVGACVGWIDAALAFPLAAGVGLFTTAVSWVMTGTIGRALPFGPSLAVATALVVLGKPLVESGLTWLLSAPAPGINLP